MQTSTLKESIHARLLCGVLLIASALSSFAQTDVWTQKSDVGTNAPEFSPRFGAIGFSIGNKGYYGTGYYDIYKKDFWEYDVLNNAWTQKADFAGVARIDAVGFSIGNLGYVGTGQNDGTFFKDFWEYDPASNSWLQKADFAGVARSDAVGFPIGGKGYLGTGYSDVTSGSFYLYDDFWEYDPLMNMWIQKANFSGGIRAYACGFAIGDKGYLGTGLHNDLFKDFWEYDPLLDLWSQKADFGGAARIQVIAFTINGKGYLGTGYDSGAFKDFWEYDPSNDSWMQKADALTSCWGAQSFSIGNRGYLVGGGSWGTAYNDVFEFDPDANSWIKIGTQSKPGRVNAVGFSIGSKGYIGTGVHDVYKKDFWEYDPGLNTWTQKADFGGTARREAVGFSIGGKGYLGTGQNTGAEKDFWEYDPAINTWKNRKGFEGDARYSAVGFSIGSKGYIGTGTKSNDLYTDFWEYDPMNNIWTEKAYLPPYNYKRKGAVGFSIGNKGYVGTGSTIYGYQLDFLEYDPDLNTWTQKKNFGGTERGYAVGFSIGNKGYVGTGEDNYYVRNDFWEYNPDSCFSFTAYSDGDNDGFGDPFNSIFISDCIIPVGYVTSNADCDDNNAMFNPSATEVCDNIDNNCDGNIDEGVTLVFYADADSDQFGDSNNSIFDCLLPNGFVNDSTDCDDSNATIFPGAQEIPNNGIDDNCDGYIDEFGVSLVEVNANSLFTIFPNPAVNQTTIQFSLTHSSQVDINVYDMSGKKVIVIINDQLNKGDHSYQLNTIFFLKGIYIVRMKSEEEIQNRKLVVQ